MTLLSASWLLRHNRNRSFDQQFIPPTLHVNTSSKCLAVLDVTLFLLHFLPVSRYECQWHRKSTLFRCIIPQRWQENQNALNYTLMLAVCVCVCAQTPITQIKIEAHTRITIIESKRHMMRLCWRKPRIFHYAVSAIGLEIIRVSSFRQLSAWPRLSGAVRFNLITSVNFAQGLEM